VTCQLSPQDNKIRAIGFVKQKYDCIHQINKKSLWVSRCGGNETPAQRTWEGRKRKPGAKLPASLPAPVPRLLHFTSERGLFSGFLTVYNTLFLSNFGARSDLASTFRAGFPAIPLPGLLEEQRVSSLFAATTGWQVTE
jgi:hypothetical protein